MLNNASSSSMPIRGKKASPAEMNQMHAAPASRLASREETGRSVFGFNFTQEIVALQPIRNLGLRENPADLRC